MTHRWILVEGLPGSGKSTSCRTLAGQLRAEGFRVELIAEGGETPRVGLPWSYSLARDSIEKTRLGTYPVQTWTAPEVEQLSIVDARFLQNTALFAFLQGEKDVSAIPNAILDQLGDARLIYLRPSKPREHLRETLAMRREPHPEWFAFMHELFEEQPWCQRRGFRGAKAIEEALTAWNETQAELVQTLSERLQALTLEDPADDWRQSLLTMKRFALGSLS